MHSPRLERFSKKDDNLWNCRCPFCGDSKKDKTKARGYFLLNDDTIFYKCHNCEVSFSIHYFLKVRDLSLYNDMIMESMELGKTKPPKAKKKITIASAEKELSKLNHFNPISHCAKCSRHDADTEINRYMLSRHLPLDKFYHIDNPSPIIAELNERNNRHYPLMEIPAVGIPYWNSDGTILNYIQFRFINANDGDFRYLTLKANAIEKYPKIFGLDAIDKNKRITIMEGAFDSVFINNSLSLGSASDKKALELAKSINQNIPIRIALDTDYRFNRQIYNTVSRFINDGLEVVLLPSSFKYKDVNMAITRGVSRDELNSMFDKCTYSGMEAKLRLSEQKRF